MPYLLGPSINVTMPSQPGWMHLRRCSCNTNQCAYKRSFPLALHMDQLYCLPFLPGAPLPRGKCSRFFSPKPSLLIDPTQAVVLTFL